MKLCAESETMTIDQSEMLQQGMLRLPPLDPAPIVMMGFKDCAEEAIRYLTEVEKLPSHDPLVMGLREHLVEKEKSLDISSVLTMDTAENSVPTLQPCSSLPENFSLATTVDSPSCCMQVGDSDVTREVTDAVHDLQFQHPLSLPHILPQCNIQQDGTLLPGDNIYSLPILSPVVHYSQDTDAAVRCVAQELLSLLEAEAADDSDDEDYCPEEQGTSDSEMNDSLESVEQ